MPMVHRSAHSKWRDVLTWIYFALADNTHRIKIGQSNSLRARIQSFRTNSPDPVHFICAIRAYDFIERALHVLFEEEKIHGEWFDVSPRLMKFILPLQAKYSGGRVPTDVLLMLMREANLSGSAEMVPWYERLQKVSNSEGKAPSGLGYRREDFELLQELNLVSNRGFSL